jgi:hypothetical protein
VQSGEFVAVQLQDDGTFRLRVTSEGLDAREEALLNDRVGPLGLVVRSGKVYASGMDLPCEPFKTYAKRSAGAFFDLPPGEYDVVVHELDLASIAEEERAALPDFVAVIWQREAPFPGLRADPHFTGSKALELITMLTNPNRRALHNRKRHLSFSFFSRSECSRRPCVENLQYTFRNFRVR